MTFGYGDNTTARVAVVGQQGVETADARRTTVADDIALTTQRQTALGTHEVLDVPELTVGLRAFIGEYYLQQTHATRIVERSRSDKRRFTFWC